MKLPTFYTIVSILLAATISASAQQMPLEYLDNEMDDKQLQEIITAVTGIEIRQTEEDQIAQSPMEDEIDLDYGPLFESLPDFPELISLFEAENYLECANETIELISKNQMQALREPLLYLLAESLFFVGRTNSHVSKLSLKMFFYLHYNFPNSYWESEILIRLGDLHRRMDYRPEATGFYKLVVESYPAHPALGYVYRMIGTCCFQDGHFKEALDWVHQALDRQQHSMERAVTLLLASKIMFEMEMYEEIIQAYQEAIEKTGDMEFMDECNLFYFGESLFRSGQHEKANGIFSSQVKRFPNSIHYPDALERMGEILQIQDRPDQAVALFLVLRKRYPQTSVSYRAALRLAEIYHGQSIPDLEKSKDLLTEVINQGLDKQLKQEALYRIAQYLSMEGRALSAIANLRELLNDVEDNSYADDALCLMHREFSRLSRAWYEQNHCDWLVALFRVNMENLLNDLLEVSTLDLLGLCHLKLYLYESCNELFSYAFVQRKYPVLSAYYQAHSLRGMGEAEQALQRFNWVVEAASDPDLEARALLELAGILQSEDLETSLILLSDMPDDASPTWRIEAYLRLGTIRTSQGDHLQAMDHFGSAFLLIEQNQPLAKEFGADVLFGLAESVYQIGRMSGACELFQRAIKEYPEEVRVPFAMIRISQCEQRQGLYSEAEDVLSTELNQAHWKEILSAFGKDLSWWRQYREREEK